VRRSSGHPAGLLGRHVGEGPQDHPAAQGLGLARQARRRSESGERDVPSSSTSTFAGLMSLWIRPRP